MQALSRARAIAERNYNSWDRARLSVVVPIGVIVAVAILCIVVAVLSSAQRADEVAIDHERQLIDRAINNHGERLLRELQSALPSDTSPEFNDEVRLRQRIDQRLLGLFEHDYTLLVDANDRLAHLQNGLLQPSISFEAARPDLDIIVSHLRGRSGPLPNAIHMRDFSANGGTAFVHSFIGQPAIVVGAFLGQIEMTAAPLVVSVKLIDEKVLGEVAARLGLANLRRVGVGPVAASDREYSLRDASNEPIAIYAWTPRQPGAEIVNNVIPFIAVALAGFALLAAFVLGYMRRTAAAIATGESRLRYLAMHDPLCGLPNRIFFGDRLEALIVEVKKGSSPAAVFYIDLDHFKEVNDTLGHPVGDELIRNVTLRLSRALRGDDLVARLGGDEFAVISRVGADQRNVMMLADRIIGALCAPYLINSHNIVIGASIGIALIEKSSGSSADIMRYADMALYRAKNEGRNRACIYDSAMDADLSNRKMLEIDLRKALENDELRLLYQPIVNASGEKTVGVEALCRWTHPTRGEIPPSEFIPIAEHSGLIIELGEWALRRACTDAKTWPGIFVSVNVSPLQFRRADFPASVEAVLAQTGFDPARLMLEVTESTLIGNVDNAEAAMRRLKSLGVRLALDDFGTGYSSLQYLRRFPFDTLKIDRGFVRSIEKAADAAAIVHAIVSLGRGLGMKVTAEGVETADQQLFLRAAGVHSMQGFRFGRAVPAEEITARLAGAMPATGKPAALAG
ncbi:MAG: bifunctional diguanylate cyclase/phosphodiesterase [Pseudolabrys sp.]|nr:bifunctional diguanylate cyclase/phosphodiesterase [Pseudolabrys sp.]MBV9954746.1 bifunctional diguanylate cyclase/phosphodiesterase [Pseudolabrys sp.]